MPIVRQPLVQAERISIVKVSFDYDAAAASELSVQEDEILHVYEQDDAWLLVQSQKEGGLVGYVPENYTEEVIHSLLVSRYLVPYSNFTRFQKEKNKRLPAHQHSHVSSSPHQ